MSRFRAGRQWWRPARDETERFEETENMTTTIREKAKAAASEKNRAFRMMNAAEERAAKAEQENARLKEQLKEQGEKNAELNQRAAKAEEELAALKGEAA
jgi:predicted nuclease with TOPRIM domain